jgi:hypothetical protein
MSLLGKIRKEGREKEGKIRKEGREKERKCERKRKRRLWENRN